MPRHPQQALKAAWFFVRFLGTSEAKGIFVSEGIE
jgi:hypothetical protein